MSETSLENLSTSRRRPTCRKLFDDEESENEIVGNSTGGDRRYLESITDALMKDTSAKSDFYNFDFINERPLPAFNESSGFDWSYYPTNCPFYIRQPYKKGDSLIPPAIVSRKDLDDNVSAISEKESNVTDLRTPAKRNPSETETFVEENMEITTSTEDGNETGR